MVSIHMNKFSQGKPARCSSFFDREQEEGKALAQALEQRLLRWIRIMRGSQARRLLYLERLSRLSIGGVRLLSNREEERLLAEESYQQRLAQAIACRVEDYFTNRIERRP